jgi:hypothetical protein
MATTSFPAGTVALLVLALLSLSSLKYEDILVKSLESNFAKPFSKLRLNDWTDDDENGTLAKSAAAAAADAVAASAAVIPIMQQRSPNTTRPIPFRTKKPLTSPPTREVLTSSPTKVTPSSSSSRASGPTEPPQLTQPLATKPETIETLPPSKSVQTPLPSETPPLSSQIAPPTSTPISLSFQTVSPTHGLHQSAVPHLLKHLNVKQIKEYFRDQPLHYEQIPEIFPKPRNDDYDTIAIYSKRNWLKLRSLINASKVTMLVNGGSSMTGVGLGYDDEVCTTMFSRSFSNMTIVDRAHGDRNTFHSTQFIHSYFPEHADILLWEFAINDDFSSKSSSINECRNMIILYLEQVARVAKQRQQEPPLVIMLYLWNYPFEVTNNGKVYTAAAEAHRNLVESYDFVVGHVNVAKYFESWQLSNLQTKAIGLADEHHPNPRGQLIMTYLLNDFLMNEQRPEKPKVPYLGLPLTWVCGEDSLEKHSVRDLVTHRYPIASFTAEVPRNEDMLEGMLLPNSYANFTIQVVHIFNARRQDRQGSIVLPCCHTGNATFPISHQYRPLQGIQPHLHPEDNHGATVYFDGENVTHKLITSNTSWPCIFGYHGKFLYHWIVLEQERNVSDISFCNHQPTCGTENASAPFTALMSMALYGGTREQ